ncbi:MAG: type 4a pilus biogenesis protein PilO [Kiritimatiellia bacterium]|nr:type 4a pilus biogenesis protein PilO [Kiritimatiellia bacterium]
MKITPREMMLGWLAGLVILISLSLWICSPKVKVWKELNDKKEAVTSRIGLAERLVAQREQWNKRLQDVAQKLSKYPPDQDVTADYLKILESIVKENGVTLSQRKPQKEKTHDNLYKLAIDCTWEADLGSLVHFLYALEQQKVTMDIDDLNISFAAGGKSKLKGNFALICLYTRTGTPAAEQKKNPRPPGKK